MLFATVLSFLSAVTLAALIGAERELAGYKRTNGEGSIKQFGGIRTHMLIGLLGGLSVFLSQEFQNFLIFLCMGGAVFLLLLTHYIHKSFVSNNIGLTTTLTGLITYLIGGLCVAGYGQLAVMITIAVTVILLSKQYTRSLLDHIERKELINTLKFAAILFVILPLLPTTAVDPWGLIIPQKIWQVVVLISGISYVGYIFSKIFGQKKGIILAGMLGGLASSTAVTSSMAQQSKHVKTHVHPFVIATVIASCMMFFRVLFWVLSFNQALTWHLLPSILAMGVTGTVIIAILWILAKSKTSDMTEQTEAVELESPFQIIPALKFALFFLVITVLSQVAMTQFGEQGVYLVSFLSGFADVDAITVTLSGQALTGQISMDVAAKSIIIAMMVNTSVKLCIAKLFGGKRFGNTVMAAFGAILLAGGLSLLFL